MLLDPVEILSLVVMSALAGYALHAALKGVETRTQEDLKTSIKKVEEASPAILRYEIKQEIERLERRLQELRMLQKEQNEKPPSTEVP